MFHMLVSTCLVTSADLAAQGTLVSLLDLKTLKKCPHRIKPAGKVWRYRCQGCKHDVSQTLSECHAVS